MIATGSTQNAEALVRVVKGRSLGGDAWERLKKNRAAMVDYMEDVLTVAHWFLDPKNHDEVAQIASKITKAPPERFGWLFTNKDNYRDPNLMPDLAALQKNIDTTRDLGFVKKPIDIKKFADLTLVTEAAKRLK